MKHLLPFALACATLPVYAQTPPSTPPPEQPGMQAKPILGNGRSASETSRISRLIAGPDGRPQGLLLHNGTFVALSPGLARQVPATVRRNTAIQVRGLEYSNSGEKTIQAQNLLIAGVSYADDAAAPGAPGFAGTRAGMPAPPPPPPGAPRGIGAPPPPQPPPPPLPGTPDAPAAAGGPGMAPPPPPPPPCGNGAVPPPPPPPSPNGAGVPRPRGTAPVVPAPPAASSANRQ